MSLQARVGLPFDLYLFHFFILPVFPFRFLNLCNCLYSVSNSDIEDFLQIWSQNFEFLDPKCK